MQINEKEDAVVGQTTLSNTQCDNVSNAEGLIVEESSINEAGPTHHSTKMSKFARNKKIKKIAKHILSVICWIFDAFVLLLCLNNFYQQTFNPDSHTGMFGIGTAIVASDSMDSNSSTSYERDAVRIQKNDLVFYKEAEINKINPQDIVIYKMTTSSGTEKLIIHRVQSIDDEMFIAKGDNNSVADDAMPNSSIVGSYWFKINDIGAIFKIFATKWCSLVIILIILTIFAIRITFYYFKKKKVISQITTKDDNRIALDYFFDI